MEEANSTRQFEQMVGGISVESHGNKLFEDRQEEEDEREVEESIKAWYGLDDGIGQQMSGGTRTGVSTVLFLMTAAVTALSLMRHKI